MTHHNEVFFYPPGNSLRVRPLGLRKRSLVTTVVEGYVLFYWHGLNPPGLVENNLVPQIQGRLDGLIEAEAQNVIKTGFFLVFIKC